MRSINEITIKAIGLTAIAVSTVYYITYVMYAGFGTKNVTIN